MGWVNPSIGLSWTGPSMSDYTGDVAEICIVVIGLLAHAATLFVL